LWRIDPSNHRWPEIASDIINDHDFSRDTYLSFRQAGLSRMDTELKEHFRQPLLKKIDQCSELSCPVSLFGDLFTPKEALTLVGDGYLSGHFSLRSLTEDGNLIYIQRMYMEQGEVSVLDLRELFGRESSNGDRERRRQLALLWLKDKPWLTGDRWAPRK
jgi:hypothetical protein